ncbi:Druantia anti-phage system protein DruA [Burkholderia ubonensis]|uniref:Druantia anti-phage system protein DruA n=1 Tax=Burkholderia ubonensis TaxID=101571 RepID=UPI0018DF6E12|nr:Druantia anti-phage system protein DruA [Burkholderia ubonensis]
MEQAAVTASNASRCESQSPWQRVTGAPEGDDWRLFKPRIDDDGAAYEQLRQLLRLEKSEALARLSDLANPSKSASPHDLRIRVSAAILRDLLQIGWEFHLNSHWIYVRPPKTNSLAGRKQSIRQQLLFGRDDQLTEESNRRFLFSLERPTKYSSARPVTDLIADGRRLFAQIEAIKKLDHEVQVEALGKVCQPYLQLVSDERDQHTNIRLIDIWRYFRHSWSTRYRSTPGRNLFYLVRDAAQPNHPVMGIAALGNTVMQLTPRDRSLGWTVDGLLELIGKGTVSDSEILDAFRSRLEEDYAQLFLDDLPVDSRIDHSVDDETLSRLAVIEENSVKEREDSLKSDDAAANANRAEDLTPERLLRLTRTPLYRSKRARAVREILRAYRVVGKWTGSVHDLVSTEMGEWAVGVVIKQMKKRHSATSMMEITVCGAVPPYNHLLGGKLVCLLMMSPRVIKDYQGRYQDVVSIIASQMAGKPIKKVPHLAFLGTTSLYTDHSAQYNRVRLPVGTVKGQRDKIEYRYIGKTEGFGSPNLSSETEQGLALLAEESKNFRNVNFVFGEGQSPKLRQLREGFAALGLDQSNLLKHGSPRIIYGVPLATNLERTLLGVDVEPTYALDLHNETSESEISNYWIKRWLASRINHIPALQALQASSPLKERVSRLIPERAETPSGQRSLFSPRDITTRIAMTTESKADERLRFIRFLYRNESAFSDHVNISRLKALNIRTKLEEVVRKIVRAGGSVVITGNAGDGKTHAIMLMKNDLKGAEVITDASEFSAAEIAKRWQKARDEGRPFCIAINEGPLVDLIRSHRKDHPWLDEIQSNLLKRVAYRPLDSTQVDDDETWKPVPGETIVIDLSLRRVLSEDLTGALIDKLTDDQWYESCATCPAQATCGVTYNRKMLRSELPKKRMVKLLVTVGERGARVTFREALGFVSYLIFGGRTCDELSKIGKVETARYYWNAFEGEGAIFEHLSRGLDPVNQTHARVDEQLWRGVFASEDFIGNEALPLLQRNLDEVSDKEPQTVRLDFTALKRRWYFEHKDGRLLLLSDADKLFQELQDTQLAMAIRLSRLLALLNGWWNKGDAEKSESLRLWTRLTYSPRSRSQAMVSGLSVARPRLGLYKPELSPVLRRAFGDQPTSHLVLGSVDDPRFARLVVDTTLLQSLLTGSMSEGSDEITRRLGQFNDALSQYAEKSSDIRTVEVLDPHSEIRTTVVVDLAKRRYDSAT